MIRDLLADNASVAGRLVTTAAIALIAIIVALVVGRLAGRRAEDALTRYHVRKGARYVVAFLTAIALAILWRPFAGQIGVVVGLFAAGVAFAMQEVVGAIAGWFNIVSGRIFRVGDRIQMGGVRGDVIDITPLRTKILEMGSATNDEEAKTDSWVSGRQFTGRIIAVSNKTTFTEPVFNYSAAFEYIWEELTIPVKYESDWNKAEAILLAEVRLASSSKGARDAIDLMAKRYPIPRAEVEPRVFARATDNWLELAARFVVPVRTARTVKDEVTRRILKSLKNEGIEIASETLDATIRPHEGPKSP